MSTEDAVTKQTFRDFIDGCHILHHHRVLDAYGHLSVRNPHNPKTFFMSRDMAPATISSDRDLVEYYIKNAESVDRNSPKGHSERYIHSEVLKRFPGMNAVVHSHSEAVVPHSISGVPFEPCFNMAGFLGKHTPSWDIGNAYQDGDTHDMLVSNRRLGESLAMFFGHPGPSPERYVVLMRGHGMTVCGPTIPDAVLRAIYTQQNAGVQTTALVTRAAHFGIASGADTAGMGELKYLSGKETEDTESMTRWSANQPWRLWLREVEAAGVYVNSA